MEKRIYLDNAATSWPKPEAVYEIVNRYMRELGAPAGRGVYREAAEVERLIGDARRRVSELIAAGDPRRIIFTNNGTDSLNLALHGLLKSGDHVITSVVEHNSLLRPLRHLEETRDVSVTRVPCDSEGIVDPEEIRKAIRPTTRLIALVHASNVTGALQPVVEVGKIAREHDVLYLVDAAQSLGHVPIDVNQMGANFLAAPGHKGLLGPLGIGVLYVAPECEDQLSAIRQGGTGTQSDDDRQPDSLPDKYESGNHNVPAILGLGAGAAFVQEKSVTAIQQHDQMLTKQLLTGLNEVNGLTIHGPANSQRQLGVVSVTVEGYEPQEFAMMLDSACSIQVRAGIQCAPLMHRSLGTASRGGTVRFSLGIFNTAEEIEAAINAVQELASATIVG